VGDETSISWAQKTWNPWRGCTRVSTGCDGCYMFRDQRRYGRDPEIVVRAADPTFYAPVRRWRGADPSVIFTCSWSDWFHADADPWRDEAWDVIRRSPQHTYMILTKRPGRIHRCLPADWGDGWPNVWLGVSIETARFNHRADQLRRIPAALRFLSCEPLVGSLYPSGEGNEVLPSGSRAEPQSGLNGPGGSPPPSSERDRVTTGTPGGVPAADGAQRGARGRAAPAPLDLDDIGLVIVGGESGPRRVRDGSDIPPARPMHPQWAREIRDHVLWGDMIPCGDGCCHPPDDRPVFHFKQWGAWVEDPHGRDPDGVWVAPDGRVETRLSMDALGLGSEMNGAVRMRYAGSGPDAGGHVLDGTTWREMPERPVLA
jgi:protein gp37